MMIYNTNISFQTLLMSEFRFLLKRARELGEVVYKMADSACSNHQMENGDATFLEEGTPIYEFKGYPSDLMVIAKDKVYVVDMNIKAKTAAELVPMRNLIKNIHIESTEDGERIHTFSQPSKTKFLDAWDELKLEDIRSSIKMVKWTENDYF